MADEKVRWGILGATARIAQGAVIPALCESDRAQLVAVASRSLQSARDVAGECGEEGVAAYGDYDSLLADPNVEAVYIPLPNNLHVGWAVEAMNNGKHVLCEKPLAMNGAEAREMLQTASDNGVLLSEAFMYWYHPLQQEVFGRLRNGDIGDILQVRAVFSFVQTSAEDYRRDPSMGGGALLDVGCYGVHIARQAMGREPVGASATWTVDPAGGVDTTTVALLDFGDNASARVECSFAQSFRASYEIIGSGGAVVVDKFFGADKPSEGQYALSRTNMAPEIKTAGRGNMYVAEMEAFSRRVRGESVPLLPASDGVNNMAALDAIAQSARTGTPVSLA